MDIGQGFQSALYAFDVDLDLLSRLTAEAADTDAKADSSIKALDVNSLAHSFDGTTWERSRVNEQVIWHASAARTATGNTANFINRSGSCMYAHLSVTAVSGTSITLNVKVRGGNSDLSLNRILQDKGVDVAFTQMYAAGGHTLTANGAMVRYTGYADTVFSVMVPRGYRFDYLIAGGSPSFTFSIQGNLTP